MYKSMKQRGICWNVKSRKKKKIWHFNWKIMKKNKDYGHRSWRDRECLKVNWLVEVHFSAVRGIKKTPQKNRLSYTFLATASSSAPSPITTYTALRPNLWETRSKQLSLPVKRSQTRIYNKDNIRYILLGDKLKVPLTGSLMLFLQKERIITQKHSFKKAPTHHKLFIIAQI